MNLKIWEWLKKKPSLISVHCLSLTITEQMRFKA